MFRTRARSALPCIVLACLLATAPSARAGSELDQKQAALDTIVKRIKSLSSSIERDQAEKDQMSRDLRSSERRIAAVRGKLRKLRSQIDDQTRQIHDSQARIADARRQIEHRTESLRRQIRAAYMIGRQGQSRLLLNQSDVSQVGRMLVYYDYFQRAQAKALAEIHARIDSLEALNARLQNELARLSELESDQKSTLDQLGATRRQRASLLKALRERLHDERGQLKQLQADERSIQSLINRLRDAMSDLPPDAAFSDQPFANLRGKLPWPVRGKLIARYGQDKAGGKLSWKGNWIAADEGTPVRAVARGRTVYVGWMHRYGLIVLIEHEGGYFSLYGHAQAADVAVGDAVRAGQVIAQAGDSGGHERSGVYFELRKGATAIDPQRWLAR